MPQNGITAGSGLAVFEAGTIQCKITFHAEGVADDQLPFFDKNPRCER